MSIGVGCDEVRLAGILELLQGRLQLRQDGHVDVSATNSARVLGGRALSRFRAAASADIRHRFEELSDPLTPCRVAVCVLAGGLNTRGHGAFGPLRRVGQNTLLGHHLQRFQNSPLQDAPFLVFCSPVNAQRVCDVLGAKARVYAGGLAPRLSPIQPPTGALIPACEGGWNPTGHFDALRWLVISGALEWVWDQDILLIHSLTNFGHIYHRAHAVARFVLDASALAAVEVSRQRLDKRTGSLAVLDEAQNPYLVKYGYGPGMPLRSGADHQLMSTNTWWLSIHSFKQHLGMAYPELRRVVRAAARGERREEAAALVDLCLPVAPVLTSKKLGNQRVLQAERDLDQLTLLPVAVRLLLVGLERGVSIKREADLADPAKRSFLVDEKPAL